MPAIARKVVVHAADDGLVLQPLSAKGQKPLHPVQVKYKDASVSAISRDQLPSPTNRESSFDAFGVLGLVSVSAFDHYVVTIIRRQQVAHIHGYPIYVITEVAVTPCSSKSEADKSIRRTASLLQTDSPRHVDDESDSGDFEPEIPLRPLDDLLDEVSPESDSGSFRPRSSIAEDVICRRGSYGRFARRWFSQSGWDLDQRRSLGMSNPISPVIPPPISDDQPPAAVRSPILAADDPETLPTVSTLLPKLLRAIRFLFGSSRSFYYSYEVDITRNLAQAPWSPSPAASPLHLQVDKTFFWNRHLLEPFIAASQHCLALPVMQGYVGQKTFVVDSQPRPTSDIGADVHELCSLSEPGPASASSLVPPNQYSVGLRPSEKSYLLTLISRRSTKRAGLRYLRRGVDEDGCVANMVETEQLLSSPTWDSTRPVQSFLQVRGSIPLFFTQSAYSLKPVPVVQHSPEVNFAACRRHLKQLVRNYGALQIVSLVEQHGLEEPIGTLYQKNVELFNHDVSDNEKLPFEWFDFHQACRGMKFENVSQLLLRLKNRLEELGSSTQLGDVLVRKQKGIFRTNCMDCLDRTNVCQSSFAKHMLEIQLAEEGFDLGAQEDQEAVWFNTLWADNGDAVSKQYASTAAMKGDYTRTKKRDYRGALNDLGLSLARFYSGMVNDYFSQTAIDFLLGNVTAKVFDEFESEMMTKDPAVSVSKMRERAIELCQKRVVADASEEVHGAWVLISPKASDVVKSWPMEEAVLLLTAAALYLCRFDWDLDKVSSFERVHLASVRRIRLGTYITSTISPAHMDEKRNVGFVVEYQPAQSNIRRANTRTLSTRVDSEMVGSSPSDSGYSGSQRMGLADFFFGKPKSAPVRVRRLAFKVPYIDSWVGASAESPQSEWQTASAICVEIERLAREQQSRNENADNDAKGIIEKSDIISLDEAKRNTGLLEQLGHSIKKLVWA